MEPELFQRCLNSIKGIAQNVYFHILGEPTLHPHFAKYLQTLESTSLKLNLTTNGTTLEKTGPLLLKSNALRQVNISLHAYAELPPDLANVHLKNVIEFVKRALIEKPDLYINLRLWNVGDENSNQWNNLVLGSIKENFGTSINLDHFCSRHKSFLITGRAYIHQDSRFQWPQKTSEAKPQNQKATYPKGTCRALDTHVGILHDGQVVACCLDYSGNISLGKIQEKELGEILEDFPAQNMRDGFTHHQLRHPFCQSCTFCKRFK